MTSDVTETSGEGAGRCRTWTTTQAVDAVAWGRAPTHVDHWVNRRIVCADGFRVSVQASDKHYAEDSHPSGEAPYFSWPGREIEWPFVTFELGDFSGPLTPALEQVRDDSGGVCPWTDRDAVISLLAMHGDAIGFEVDL